MSHPILHTSSSGDLKVPEMRARASSHSIQQAKPSAVKRVKDKMTKQILTDQQKELLRHSWNHVGKQGPSGIGAMIFKRIFERDSSIRRIFGYASFPLNRLSYDHNFEGHSRLFVAVLEGAIKNVDDLETRYAPILIQHGKNHTKFFEKGFKPEYWEVFAEAMTESAMEWVGPGKHRETVKAWTVLVSYIVDKMRLGYDAEMRRIKKINNGYNSCPPSPLASREASPSKRSPSPTQKEENGEFFVDYDQEDSNFTDNQQSSSLSRRYYYENY